MFCVSPLMLSLLAPQRTTTMVASEGTNDGGAPHRAPWVTSGQKAICARGIAAVCVRFFKSEEHTIVFEPLYVLGFVTAANIYQFRGQGAGPREVGRPQISADYLLSECQEQSPISPRPIP